MPLTVGTILHNRYRIEAIIAEGGMGSIYAAADDTLKIKVAVKENLFTTEESARQFQREAKILASVRHSNLPRVTDNFNLPGTGQYLVMDYIPGQDLRQVLKQRTLTEQEVINIGASVADSLTYLHKFDPPIIHRDIKPGNIKITPDGNVYLVDFGLAKMSSPSQVTTMGAKALTPGYAPPEQYGQGTEPRSDLYALGATLYAALTGNIPEDGLARAMGTASLTPIRKLAPGVSEKLAAVIEKAMEVEPSKRYPSAEAFMQAILHADPAFKPAMRTEPAAPVIPGSPGRPTTPDGRLEQGKKLPTSPSPTRRGGIPVLIMLFTMGIIAAVGTAAFLVFRSGTGLKPGFFQLSVTAPTITEIAQINSITPPATNIPALSTESTLPAEAPTAQPEAAIVPTDLPTTVVVEPAPTPLGGASGDIAFVSERSGMPQIWLMKSDGSNPVQVTYLTDGACQPAWSPDGQKLVIVSPCRTRQDIYKGSGLFIINADGGGLTPLFMIPGGDFEPAWSPDSSQIVFTSIRDGILHIYIYDLNSGKEKILSSPSSSDRHASWSPDGETIVFESTRLGTAQVWTMDSSGSSAREFSRIETGAASNPAWANNGSVIAFSIGKSLPWLVLQQAADRFAPEVSFSDLRPALEPDFSTDSYWIAFVSSKDNGPYDIYRITINGANLTRLTDDPSSDYQPAWRSTQK